MALSEKDRARLDAIVGQMEANGEPEDNIRFVVSDFKSKYEGSAFPRTKERARQGFGIGFQGPIKGESAPVTALKNIEAPLLDVLSGVGQAVSKIPGVSALGEFFDSVQRGISPEGREYPLQGTIEAAKTGLSKIPILRDLEAPGMALEVAGRTATDPLALLGAGGPGIARTAEKVSKVPGKVARTVGSATTGISKEALSEAATKAGRKGLEQAAANAPSSGSRAAEAFKTFERKMPEYARVEEALEKAGEIDLRPVIQAFDEAKTQTFGPMRSATPGMEKLNNAIEQYKRAVMGDLPTPEQIARQDFGGNLQKAREALADPESKWGVLSDIAKRADIARIKAENQALRTAKAASKSAAKYGSAPRQIPTPNDPALGGHYGAGSRGTFRGTVPNPELESMLNAAKEKAAAARRAASDLEARIATGNITAKDAAKARAELNSAKRELYEADAANEFSSGKTLDEVSSALVDRYGISGEILEKAIDRGRNFVGENSFTPNYMMSAREYKRLREALDSDIDFDTPEGRALDQALKVPRRKMKEDLEAVAGPEYAGDMKSWSQKLDLLEELRDMIGKEEGVKRDIKFTNFVKQAAKEGPGGPRYELLKRFDQEAGTNFLGEAGQAKRAFELGPEGKAQILPKGDDKRILSALFGGAGYTTAGPVGAGATALFTSPAALTRATIPAADATGRVIRAAGRVPQKIKPADAVKASALMQLLGMENQ